MTTPKQDAVQSAIDGLTEVLILLNRYDIWLDQQAKLQQIRESLKTHQSETVCVRVDEINSIVRMTRNNDHTKDRILALITDRMNQKLQEKERG